MTHVDATPAALGFRWPAEWEPHAATWLAWPHNVETWPGIFARIEPQFAALARKIAEFEPVHVLAGGPEVLAHARHYLADIDHITLHDIPTNDAWCRDHGPTFLVPSSPPEGSAAQATASLALIDWQYNAWGGKYPPYDLDNAVSQRIAAQVGCRRFTVDAVLEGGAIDGNGRGTLLTTASCLLNPNRNPGWDRQEMERLLRDQLGAAGVLWLPRGELAGDDTDGHVDQLARFVGPRTIVAAVAQDSSDPNFAPLRENLATLQLLTDQDRALLEIVPLPLPQPRFQDGHRLPASYCNFYFVNGGVIVPQFDDPADEQAIETLRELLPNHTVMGLPAADLVWGLGAFHCLTQQQPCAGERPASPVEA